jgi:hypothetical protein
MKTKIATTLALLMCCTSGFSATVSLNKGLSPGFTIKDKDGNPIQSYLFIGSFAAAPTTPVDGIYTTTIANFRSFDLVADRISVASGAVVGAVASSWANVPTTPENFNGLQMYLLISNTPDYANATQFGLFTNSPTSLFAANTTTATSTNYSVGTFASNLVVAGAGSKIDNASGADVLKLVTVIPETSTALLGALGALGLLRRRR